MGIDFFFSVGVWSMMVECLNLNLFLDEYVNKNIINIYNVGIRVCK